MSRELDLQIAKNIFGIKKVYSHKYADGLILDYFIPSGKPWRTHQIDSKPLPRFSSDPEAAYVVMLKWAGAYCWRITSPFYQCDEWFAGLWPLDNTESKGEPIYGERGATMMEAICKVALRPNPITKKIEVIEV